LFVATVFTTALETSEAAFGSLLGALPRWMATFRPPSAPVAACELNQKMFNPFKLKTVEKGTNSRRLEFKTSQDFGSS
jgi:hypothetical protein